jgi:ANTAR domain
MAADDRDDLRAEIGRMLAAALSADEGHVSEMNRRDALHIAETDRRDVLHHTEMQRRQDGFEQELLTIRDALETRDLIGQAKGIIMGSMGCTADEAFVLLKKQSQAENRKLTEIAADIVSKTQRRR